MFGCFDIRESVDNVLQAAKDAGLGEPIRLQCDEPCCSGRTVFTWRNQHVPSNAVRVEVDYDDYGVFLGLTYWVNGSVTITSTAASNLHKVIPRWVEILTENKYEL